MRDCLRRGPQQRRGIGAGDLILFLTWFGNGCQGSEDGGFSGCLVANIFAKTDTMGRAFEFRKERKMKRWAAMSKIFARLNKDIILAIKEGGGIADPDTNARLRAVLQNCKAANMPKDNIERAIKKATDKDTSDYKEVTFEGYGPHGIAVYVETATDNNNRTVANVRSHFNRGGGQLAPRVPSNSCSTACASSTWQTMGWT